MSTVVFGPFIGEFGWELANWQWWVRKLCLKDFKDFRKIAVSFPGRAAFYPYVDEFWPIPQWYLELGATPHGYITAGWRHGLPGYYVEKHSRVRVPDRWLAASWPLRLVSRAVRKVFPTVQVRETRLTTPDVEPHALKMLADLQRQLPDDTLFLIPWQPGAFSGVRFGVDVPSEPKMLGDFVTHPVPLTAQRLEALRPTSRGEQAFQQLFPGSDRLIGVFPRAIRVRRGDRNWPQQKYRRLIQRLQARFPEYQIAIFGEPGGAYFAGATPSNCLSLIDVPPDLRLDLQLAALQRCLFSLGAISGGLSMALAGGCPVLWWGYEYAAAMVHRCNPLGTPMFFYPRMQPTVDEVFRLALSVDWMIEHGSWPRHANVVENDHMASTTGMRDSP